MFGENYVDVCDYESHVETFQREIPQYCVQQRADERYHQICNDGFQDQNGQKRSEMNYCFDTYEGDDASIAWCAFGILYRRYDDSVWRRDS